MKTEALPNGTGKMNPTKERHRPSADEIKEKLAKRKADSQLEVQSKEDSTKVEIDHRANIRKESEERGEQVNPGDVKLNNPNDPNTREKLKAALATGAFSFNPKERQALENILKDQ